MLHHLLNVERTLSRNASGSSVVNRLRNVHSGTKVHLLHVTASAPVAVPARPSSVAIVHILSILV